MQRTPIFATLGLALLLNAAPAQAQWYAGAGIGATDARLEEGAQSASQLAARGFSGAVSSRDKRDTGGRLFGGYRVMPGLAIELGYTDLGKFGLSSRANSGQLGAGELTNEIKITGADLSVVGRWPINDKLSLLGRAGAFAAESESNAASAGTIVLLRDNGARYKDRETVATFGFGAEYRLAPKMSLRGEWSRYEKIKTIDVIGAQQETSVNLYTVGVTIDF